MHNQNLQFKGSLISQQTGEQRTHRWWPQLDQNYSLSHTGYVNMSSSVNTNWRLWILGDERIQSKLRMILTSECGIKVTPNQEGSLVCIVWGVIEAACNLVGGLGVFSGDSTDPHKQSSWKCSWGRSSRGRNICFPSCQGTSQVQLSPRRWGRSGEMVVVDVPHLWSQGRREDGAAKGHGQWWQMQQQQQSVKAAPTAAHFHIWRQNL